VRKRSRALAAPAKGRRDRWVITKDESTVAERWPARWPPLGLVPHVNKTLGATAGANVLKILIGTPGPWWPDGVAPISLPGRLAILQALRDDEPKRQADVAAWRRRDRQFLSVANQVRALPFKREKKAAVLESLESERVITRLRKEGEIAPGRIKPWIDKRAARTRGVDHSALRWLGPQATTLVMYLRTHSSINSDKDACARAAGILSLASGERITPDMVKDRVWRARNHK
jgi:hypothetical protein